MGYTADTWADGQAGGTAITAAKLNNIETGIVNDDGTNPGSAEAIHDAATYATIASLGLKANTFPMTAVKTAAYTTTGGENVPCDATGGTFTVTFPTAPADRTRVVVKKVDASANVVALALGGSDKFDTTTGVTSKTLTLPNQSVTAQYDTATAVWLVVGDNIPLSQLDVRYPVSRTKTKPVGVGELFINVMDAAYGAVGDGTTDDTAAIQSAINALSASRGGIVFLPPGLFNCTSLYITNPNVTLTNFGGSGTIYNGTVYVGPQGSSSATRKSMNTVISVNFDRATRSAALANNAVSVANCYNVTIEDLYVNNYSALLFTPNIAMQGSTDNQHAARLKVDNVRTSADHNNTGPIDYLAYLSPCTNFASFSTGDLTVTNCSQVVCELSHVYADSLDGLVVTGNTFFFTGSDRANPNKKQNISVTTRTTWVIITDNELFEAGLEGIRLESPTSVTITGNQVAYAGERVISDGIAIDNKGGAIRGIIANNHLESYTKNAVALYGTGNNTGMKLGPNSAVISGSITTFYGTGTPGPFNRYFSDAGNANVPTINDGKQPYGSSGNDSLNNVTSESNQLLGARSQMGAFQRTVAAGNFGTFAGTFDGTADFGGIVIMTLTDTATQTHAATYVFAISWSTANTAGQAITLISATGETTGATSNSPSFTFTLDTSRHLVGAVVGSTTGTFTAAFLWLGNIKVA